MGYIMGHFNADDARSKYNEIFGEDHYGAVIEDAVDRGLRDRRGEIYIHEDGVSIITYNKMLEELVFRGFDIVSRGPVTSTSGSEIEGEFHISFA